MVLSLRYSEVNDLRSLAIVGYENIRRLEILMDDLALMQVPQARHKLASDIFDLLDVLWRSFSLEPLLHVNCVDVFEDDVERVLLFTGVIFSHEVVVFDDAGVRKIFGNKKFAVHSP